MEQTKQLVNQSYTICGEEVTLFTPAPYSIEEDGKIVVKQRSPRIIELIDSGDWLEAAKLLKQTGVRKARQACGTTIYSEFGLIKILHTTVGLSTNVPEGCYAVDWDRRVVLNPITAEHYLVDCDGDQCQIVEFADLTIEVNKERRKKTKGAEQKFIDNDEPLSVAFSALLTDKMRDQLNEIKKQNSRKEKYAVFIKYPASKGMPILKKVKIKPDTFTALSKKEVKESLAKLPDPEKDSRWAAIKTFGNPPIGEVTRRWWAFMLKDAVDNSSKKGFLPAIKESVEKYCDRYSDDLEGKLMKEFSKGSGVQKVPEIFTTPIQFPSSILASLYTTKGSIAGVRETVYDTIKGISRLDTSCMHFNEEPELWEEKEVEPIGYTSFVKKGQEDLVHYLIETGRMSVNTLASKREGVPPSVSISLWDTKHDKPVALTWVKDWGGQTAGYNFVLPPMLAYDPEAGASRIMDPVQHMAFWLSYHFQCPPITSKNFVDKMFELEKGNALEHALRKYVSLYGANVPSVKHNGIFIPNKYANEFCSQLVGIDFASIPQWHPNFEAEYMADRVEFLAKLVGPVHTAATGSKRVCRTFFYAKEDGLPSFVRRSPETNPEKPPIHCQMHRPGRNKSLLIRSCAMAKMTVAVVKTGSIQCFITPSGIAKSQPEESIFLPNVSPVPVDGWEEGTFYSWTGEERFVWLSPNPKKEAKSIGKFLCTNGSRFEPRRTKQYTTKTTKKEIDLIYSYEELVEKDLDRIFLEFAEKETIVDEDGNKVEAYVLRWVFFRSGAASENIKAKLKKSITSEGFYGLMLASTMKEKGLPYVRGKGVNNAIKYMRLSNELLNQANLTLNEPVDAYYE